MRLGHKYVQKRRAPFEDTGDEVHEGLLTPDLELPVSTIVRKDISVA